MKISTTIFFLSLAIALTAFSGCNQKVIKSIEAIDKKESVNDRVEAKNSSEANRPKPNLI